ncbi:MAG: ATP synthase F1 subunit gamma [Solobacterium sp.]|nr:ATP synthase F1 subunit gamma [Solobacterium sp.]
MAQSKQALRSRIKSVNSTRKITKAMEMIANAKLFKQRSRMEANREYAQRLQDTVDEISANNQGLESCYLKHNGSEAKGTILFCSDLGLCGGYNQNVLRLAKELNPEDPIVVIGTSLYNQIKELGFNLVNEQSISSDRLQFSLLKQFIQILTEKYILGEIGTLQILYTRFVNTMTFRAEFDQLLPCELKELKKEPLPEGKVYVETLFEPDPETILNQLIPMMIQDVAWSDWMESTTSEQGSRRVAMKTATDNADELSESLMLEYNKARQAAITQEITEIVSGSAAV